MGNCGRRFAALCEFVQSHSSAGAFNPDKALCAKWKSADLLFQLTDQELSGQKSLFEETDVTPGLLQSYLFFAIELTGDSYARGKLTDIARQINRAFPMPVMMLIKHKSNKEPVLSIAVINRRQHKRDTAKDVLGKVFENLLASYNEETKTTARKQTGSFYTPRPIVEYMVDQSLLAHLTTALTKAGMFDLQSHQLPGFGVTAGGRFGVRLGVRFPLGKLCLFPLVLGLVAEVAGFGFHRAEPVAQFGQGP